MAREEVPGLLQSRAEKLRATAVTAQLQKRKHNNKHWKDYLSSSANLIITPCGTLLYVQK